MTDKNKFLKIWENLSENITQLLQIAETNRRILAGITSTLISKNIVSAEDIKEIEDEVKTSFEKTLNN